MEEAYKHKKLRYTELAADAKQRGQELGVRGKAHRQAIKDLSRDVEKEEGLHLGRQVSDGI